GPLLLVLAELVVDEAEVRLRGRFVARVARARRGGDRAAEGLDRVAILAGVVLEQAEHEQQARQPERVALGRGEGERALEVRPRRRDVAELEADEPEIGQG